MKLTVYITKYALTEGILEKEAKPCGNASMVQVGPSYFHGEGKDWHRTRESAVKKAEAMRLKKIESLKRSIAKLEKMTW